MNGIWLNLTRPLDPWLDRLLRDLDDILQSRKIPYLLAGGMAREILLYYGHGFDRGRATTDVDLGVTLSSWDEYEALKKAMVGSGLFKQDPKQVQRMIHRNPESRVETRVDLVPFGDIAGPTGKLAWPPDGSHVMRVLGYAQALSTAIRLRLDETRWVPMASASGLAMMKLVAWSDNGEARLGRDAVDFVEVLRQYVRILSDEELYEGYPEAMEHYNFYADPAAAWVLGRQIAELSDGPLRKVFQDALQPESRIRMINHYLKERGFQGIDDREAEAALLLDAFAEGLASYDSNNH
jgi:predicted nucleotidyltransferase